MYVCMHLYIHIYTYISCMDTGRRGSRISSASCRAASDGGGGGGGGGGRGGGGGGRAREEAGEDRRGSVGSQSSQGHTLTRRRVDPGAATSPSLAMHVFLSFFFTTLLTRSHAAGVGRCRSRESLVSFFSFFLATHSRNTRQVLAGVALLARVSRGAATAVPTAAGEAAEGWEAKRPRALSY